MPLEDTCAFLISVENYHNDIKLKPLPQSYKNVDALHKILIDDTIGISKNNIKWEHDPTDKTQLLVDLSNFVEDDTLKTVIIYYAGHGIQDDEGKHFLTTSNSTVDRINIDGINIQEISKALQQNKNINVVLILDSCFSERAFEEFKARNHLVIASSAKNRTSMYPVDADFSAFTNGLIGILKNGIDNQQDHLKWIDVYEELKKNLQKEDFPSPRISTQNEVEKQIIARNNRYAGIENPDEKWIKVIQDIAKENPFFKDKVQKILEKEDPQMISMLKEELINFFPLPIAYYLTKIIKLIDPPVEDLIKFYKSIIRFFFIVEFIDYESSDLIGKIKSDAEFRKKILNPDHEFYFSTLKKIATDYRNQKIDWFLKEFDFFEKEFEEILSDLEKQRTKENVSNQEVLQNILRLIPKLKFLSHYKLLSVKDVSLNFRKYDPLKYNHRVSSLQGFAGDNYDVWAEAEEEWKKAFYRSKIAKNDRSVIFVRCCDPTNIDYLNLWPLIIDRNTFAPKSTTPHIFLYLKKEESKGYLYQGVMDLSEETFADLETLAPMNKRGQLIELLESKKDES